MLNFPFIYNFLEVELRGCDHDMWTMIEHFPFTVRYFIYSIPKAKCRPGHLNVNILNMAISHSLHLQSLHHNPHYHYLAKYLPCVNLALFILRFDSLGAGVKNTFNKNLIASEKSYPFHIFCQQESSCHSSFY